MKAFITKFSLLATTVLLAACIHTGPSVFNDEVSAPYNQSRTATHESVEPVKAEPKPLMKKMEPKTVEEPETYTTKDKPAEKIFKKAVTK